MSQLKEALKRKIAQEKAYVKLTPDDKKELEDFTFQTVKDGRRRAKRKVEFFRNH